MKREIVFLTTLLISIIAVPQRQANIWYFGDHAGLDFNSGSPVFIDDGQTYYVFCPGCHNEGTSVISDEEGDLLFYTNGEKIWNRNHDVMPNGDDLLGGGSSTQSSLIVPQPGSSRYFYVFTTDNFYAGGGLEYGFRYSLVDICLDEGFGDVVNNQKNILLLDTVTEKVTAVRHGNGIDYWVITHKYFSDAFYAYRLSALGIVDTVVSHIGAFHPTGLQNLYGAIGQLKVSPDGERLVIVNGNSNNCIAEYFDFDANSGIVSNPVNLQWNPLNQFYGASFSPDNTKLYISCLFNESGLYQFDLNAGNGNPDSVRDSRTQINNLSGPLYPSLGLQLATDGKIYLARGGNNSSYLSVINNPNGEGLFCNYIENVIDLHPMTVSFGLPNFIDSFDYSNTTSDCTVNIEDESFDSKLSIYPNPVNDELNIKFNSFDKWNVRLYDSQGIIILEKTAQGHTATLNTESLTSGIYIALCSDNSGNIFAKHFIKQ